MINLNKNQFINELISVGLSKLLDSYPIQFKIKHKIAQTPTVLPIMCVLFSICKRISPKINNPSQANRGKSRGIRKKAPEYSGGAIIGSRSLDINRTENEIKANAIKK